MILGADVGGTFTDVVLVSESNVTTAKIPTSAVQSDAIVEGLDQLAGGATVAAFIHGTTVATNALLERSGARVALITDEGFEDVIEIGRQDRPALYDPFEDRPTPLVDRNRRFGVTQAQQAVDIHDAEAVAIAFIDADIDPERESSEARRVALDFPGIPVSASSVVSPEFREFERISTTVLNAYLTPITQRYISALESRMITQDRADSMAVMRSSGGLMAATSAAGLPAAVLLSGPAGGVVAARDYASALSIDHVVSFDMGGTSTDVCRITGGKIDISYERSVDGYVCRMPSAGINTVGAGGGSIAWIDTGGALRVGPRSAGSIPGPACYGRGGTNATVTDANVVLGRIDPNAVLGGTLPIDADASFVAVSHMADALSMSVTDAALGIVAIAEDVMAGAIRTVSVDQGSDLTTATLLGFGGAGGLHAVSLAQSLGMRNVVIPPFGGVFSAIGLLLSPPRVDLVAPVLISADNLGPAQRIAQELLIDGESSLGDAGHDMTGHDLVLDVRLLGQAHEIGVPWTTADSIDTLRDRFNDMHFNRNGFSRPDDPIEIVAVRVTVHGDPALSVDDIGTWRPTSDVPRQERSLDTRDGRCTASVVDRASLHISETIVGPAVIVEKEATTYLDPGTRATVTENGCLKVTW